MPLFPGLDLARYPGTQPTQWLWTNTNLFWVGFYLPVGGPGLRDKKSWIGKYKTLRSMGWGVAPIYVGKQASPLRMTPGTELDEGLKDGFEAARFARSEGMPPGTVRHEDFRDPRSGAIVTNYEALEPSGSSAAEATSWQYAHACKIWWMDESRKKPVAMPIWPVDLDSSTYRDPGQAGYSLDIL